MISRWCQRLSRSARAQLNPPFTFPSLQDPAWIYWIWYHKLVVLISFDFLSAFPESLHGSHGTSTAGALPLCQGRPAVLWRPWPWRAASNLQPGPRHDQPSVGEIPVLWSLIEIYFWSFLVCCNYISWYLVRYHGFTPVNSGEDHSTSQHTAD